MGKTRRERIRNKHLRGEFKKEEIQTQTEESSLTLAGHVKRMAEHRIQKKKRITGNVDEQKKHPGADKAHNGQTALKMNYCYKFQIFVDFIKFFFCVSLRCAYSNHIILHSTVQPTE
jgi:hypothetical protein